MIKTVYNYAFISYSHKDSKVAEELQRRLEKYKIPERIYSKVDPNNLPDNESRYLRPIFLDKTDLTTGILVDTLRENLESARYLIVICSPNSAKSEWVSKEVQYFIETGRLHKIIPVVVDGTPYFDMQIAAGKNPDGEECMPQYLVEFTKRHPDKELLGVDLRDNGMEKTAMRIVSRMLDFSFDKIWNRHARRERLRAATYITALVLLVSAVVFLFYPIRLSYTINYPDDGNHLLMPDDAIIIIDGTSFILGSTLDTTLHLKNRAGYNRGSKLPVEFHATYFDTIRTEFTLGYGFLNHDILYVKRDNSFAVFAGRVIDQDGEPISSARVVVRQTEVRTDEEGNFMLILPLEEQAETQAIIIERAGYYDVYREDECPSDCLTYIMYRIEE